MCREALREAFDFVFHVEEDTNTGQLKLEDFVKLSAVGVARPFDKCVFISSGMMVRFAFQKCKFSKFH